MMRGFIKTTAVLLGMVVSTWAAEKTSIPETIGLPADFKPTPEQLSAHEPFAFPGGRAGLIGEISGLNPLYITHFEKGMLSGEPLAVGDVILAVDNEPLVTDPRGMLNRKFDEARKTNSKFNLTRWRAGSITQVTVNSIPEPPDFTIGDNRGKAHDWTLGPTGMRGWLWANDYATTGSKQILVTKVEAGSPADGILQVNDVILGVNGQRFNEDARIEFARAITLAETEQGGGVLRLMRWRANQAQDVEFKLPVMGTYSATAPYDCPKSKKIFEQGCEALAKRWKGKEFDQYEMIFGPLNALALLASGKEEYRPFLADYAKRAAEFKEQGMATWGYAYINLFLTEYVLETGDMSVLPGMKRMTLEAANGQSSVGTWGHRFVMPDGNLNGYGSMNQPGIVLMISLVLAKKAGVDDPVLDKAIEKGSKFLRHYVDKGVVPYGDHVPYGNHEENGKCSSAAVLFDLLGDTEAATYFSKMATAAHGERESGHMGNFFNVHWALPGVARGGPNAAGEYLKETSWYYDFARRWDGDFLHQGIPGEHDDAYRVGVWDSTGSYLLTYALPLKSLYITGKGKASVPAFDKKTAASLIADGRDFTYANQKTCYDGRTTEQLLVGLTSWSPAVRFRSAQSLARRDGDFVPALLKLLERKDRYSRYGAAEALCLLGSRADAAAPQLRALLVDSDPWLQYHACNAIPRLGPEARNASVNDVLKVASTLNPADHREFVQRMAAVALFSNYPGRRELTPLLSGSIDGVDRSLLYPAIRTLLRNQDSVPRSCVSVVFKKLIPADLAALLPDIIPAVEKMAPSDEMFADGVRMSGLDLLTSLHIREGMDLCVSTIEPRWGNNFQGRLNYLKRYGVHAKEVIPQLKQKAAEDKYWEKPIEKIISEIEVSTETPTLISLKDFIEKSSASTGAATDTKDGK